MTDAALVAVSSALPAAARAEYQAAVAQLPLSVRANDAPEGAVVVVPGAPDWPAAVVAAVAAGARAVVVADPAPVAARELDALIELSRGIPVVLDRERHRADVVADAVPSVTAPLCTARVTASAAQLDEMVRDAVGWLRVLSGGALALRAATATDAGLIALFDAPDADMPGADAPGAATLIATVLAGATDEARLAALSIAPARTEVVFETGRAARVVHDDGTGAMTVPTRFESRRRLALRRALESLLAHPGSADRGVARPTDVADIVHDARLADAIREV